MQICPPNSKCNSISLWIYLYFTVYQYKINQPWIQFTKIICNDTVNIRGKISTYNDNYSSDYLFFFKE